MKILLSCSNNHPGVKTYFSHLEKIAYPICDFHPIENLISFFPDYDKYKALLRRGRRILRKMAKLTLSKELTSYGDNVILGGWRPIYAVIIKKLNKAGIRPSILWCSTLGQSEMTSYIELNPINTILDLLAEKRIGYFLVVRKTFQSFLHVDGVKQIGYPIALQKVMQFDHVELDGRNVDLFVKARPGKNVLQQMASEKHSRYPFTLHTNIRNETLLSIAQKMGISFHQYAWLPSPQYFGLIRTMNLSLQVTWTESFNYAVCERMALGVPTLVSPEVFLISEDKFLWKHLVVDTPDSPIAIARKMDKVFQSDKLRRELVLHGKQRIAKIANEYNDEIREQIEKTFS